MAEIQIKNFVFWSEESVDGEVLEKDLEEVTKGKKEQT